MITRAAVPAAALLLAHLFAPTSALAHPGHGEHLSRAQAVTLLAGSALVLVGTFLLGSRRRWVPVSLLGIGLFSSSVGVLALPLIEGPCRGRPATEARLEVLHPQEGEVVTGAVAVRVRIIGGRLAPAAGLANRPGEGHVHISIDGQIISMIGLENQVIPLPTGRHRVTVDFVANDHATFCPPVSVTRQAVIAPPP